MLASARWLMACLLTAFLVPLATSVQAKPVVIQLKWLHQFQSAGFYAALEKGFFAEEGLDVILQERDPSTNIITTVLNGQADYGVADAVLLMHSAYGDPVVVVAAFMQHSAGALMTMADSGLMSPQDLVGKRIATYINDSDGIDILAMLAAQKVSDRGLLRVPWSDRLDRLATRQVDAVSVYTTNEPFVMAERGYKVNLITPRHFGVDLYGDMLFTSRKEVQHNPQRVDAMRRAIIRGWEYALDNKEEIIDLIVRRYNTQNKSRSALLNEAKALEVLFDRYTTAIGDINPQRVDRLYKQLRELSLVSDSGDKPGLLVYQSAVGGPDLRLTEEEKQFLSRTPTVRYAIDEAGWPPFEFMDAKGEVRGVASDYLHVIGRRLGIEFHKVDSPDWEAALDGVQTRNIDLLPSAAQTPERSQYMGFTDAYVSSPMVMVTRNDVDFIPSMSQLAGRRVGVVKGYASDELLTDKHPDITLSRHLSTQEGLSRLASGEIDVFVDNLAAAIHAITSHGLANLKISGQTPYAFDLRMAVRADWPLLLSAVNKVLGSMTQQEHAAIYDRWVGLSISAPFPWKKLLPWITLVALVMALLAIYSVRMRAMNRRVSQMNASLVAAEQALKDKNAELFEASVRDKLTGIFNRYHLDAVLSKEFERYRRHHVPFSIVMFDLDHFKRANDQFGHLAGDQVLRRFSEIVMKNIRSSDTFGRWGGEEFLLICPETRAFEALAVAEKIRQHVEAATLYEGLHQTVSAGIKDATGCQSIDEQISGADNKLYEAKSAGRNRVMV